MSSAHTRRIQPVNNWIFQVEKTHLGTFNNFTRYFLDFEVLLSLEKSREIFIAWNF